MKLPVRFSKLKHMNDSPKHYAEREVKATGPMDKGTGLHCVLLGAADKVVVYTEGNRDDRHGKFKEFKAAHPGKHILIPSQMAAVDGMRKAIEANPEAMRLLDGVQEQTIYWTQDGRAAQGTPDVVHPIPGRKFGVELKATTCAKPDKFARYAERLFYHGQCAWYSDGIEKSTAYTPGPCERYYVIAVEMSKPFDVVIYEYDAEALDDGRRTNRLWLERLVNCERSGFFPGYAQSVLALGLPSRQRRRFDPDDDGGGDDDDDGDDDGSNEDWEGIEAAE